jgi:hypothetical protein
MSVFLFVAGEDELRACVAQFAFDRRLKAGMN